MVRKVLLYGLYVCIVIGLITFIILSFTDEASAPDSHKTQTAGKSLEKSKSSPKVTEKAPATTPKSSSPSSSSTQSTPSTSSPSSGASNGSQLANTGPGDLLMVFLVTAAVSTIGFHLRQRKVV